MNKITYLDIVDRKAQAAIEGRTWGGLRRIAKYGRLLKAEENK